MDVGSLKLTKHLSGINIVSLTDEDKAKITFTVADAAGTTIATNTLDKFTVAHGETDPSWTIEGLPVGNYTVTEANGSKYAFTTTYKVNEGSATPEPAKLVVAKGEIAKVDITNTHKPDKPGFDKKIKDTNDSTGETSDWQDSRNSILTALTGNEETGMLALTANSDLSALEGSVINSKEGGNLAVKKKVSSTRSEDKTRDYGFKVTLGDKTINGKYGDMEFKDGVATFTLKDNETKRAAALPLNEKGELKYEVVETDAGSLTSSMGNPVKSKDGLTHTVTCTNTYKKPTSSTSRSSTAKTGDSTNYAAVGVFAVAGVAILAGALINKRRRSK